MLQICSIYHAGEDVLRGRCSVEQIYLEASNAHCLSSTMELKEAGALLHNISAPLLILGMAEKALTRKTLLFRNNDHAVKYIQ